MATKRNAADHDAMQTSANALTEKLYHTVMDVFGNYARSDEEDYNNMLETLRNKRMQQPMAKSAPSEADGNRGIIATKLLQGYAFHGAVCNKCVVPLMSLEGEVMCVVCEQADEDTKEANVPEVVSVDAKVELAPAAESFEEETEEAKEAFVNKQMSQFKEQRSKATSIYATKMMAGFSMHDGLCSKCDLPMMKCKGIAECVMCPPEEKEEKKAADTMIIEDVKEAAETKAEAPKPSNKTQAEILADRLRGDKSNNKDKNSELTELEKAEDDILHMIGTLGMNGGDIQEYLSKKKADRKWLKEAEDGLLEAEAIAAADEENIKGSPETGTKKPDPVAVATFVCEQEEGVFVEGGDIYSPETPKHESSISCSIGHSFLTFKNMFSSQHEVGAVGSRQSTVRSEATKPATSRAEAKQRIAALVADGWEVSADSCPLCELPLFFNPSGHTTKRCVTCGPIASNSNDTISGGSFDLVATSKGSQEDVTNKMVTMIMEGWSIVEGKQCPTCRMPSMRNPQTQQTHCVVCEETQQSPAERHPAMIAMQNKLKVDVAPDVTPTARPDPPTPSMMYDLRDQYGSERKAVDPSPSMQASQVRPELLQLTMGEPTPAAKELQFKLNDPTPNMQAVRNRVKFNDPTPNMHAVRNRVSAAEAHGNDYSNIAYLE